MSHTDQLLKTICDKMDQLIENQRQIERRLARLEHNAPAQGQPLGQRHRLPKVRVRKPNQE